MDAKSIKSIENQIYRRFPEVAGSRPSVKNQATAKGHSDDATYLLTFRGKATEGERSFARTVRVVANERGKILKVSTSK